MTKEFYTWCNCESCNAARVKAEPRTYEQGFRDGMSLDQKYPQTLILMGYKLEELVQIICEHEAHKFVEGKQWIKADIEKMKEKQKEYNDQHDKIQDTKVKEPNNKYQWAELNSGSNREFLEWLWQRLHSVFGEPVNCTHMQRLDKIIQETPGATSTDRPAFEIRYPSGSFAYKIWADGRIEGFNDKVVVINRIPQLIAEAKQKG